jgi:predicted AAA+ superfamily ATPase
VGRTGQLLNLSALGADGGITHSTAKSWISVLEASYIALRLPPLYRNLGQRLVKTPKLFFYDTGLLCYLLGIRTPQQLELHPLRGAIFETWVVAEVLKHYYHRGRIPQLFFYRDRKGNEIDLIVERGQELLTVEIKSGRTPSGEYFAALERVAGMVAGAADKGASIRKLVIYGGQQSQQRSQGQLLSWSEIDTFPWSGDT